MNPANVKNVGIAQNQAFNRFLAFHSRLKKALMKSSDDSILYRLAMENARHTTGFQTQVLGFENPMHNQPLEPPSQPNKEDSFPLV